MLNYVIIAIEFCLNFRFKLHNWELLQTCIVVYIPPNFRILQKGCFSSQKYVFCLVNLQKVFFYSKVYIQLQLIGVCNYLIMTITLKWKINKPLSIKVILTFVLIVGWCILILPVLPALLAFIFNSFHT